MINLMIGAPGGGKSYEACVYHILPAIVAGRKVITNLPVNIDAFVAIEPQAEQLLHVVRESKSNPRPFSTISDYADPWRHPESGAGPLYVIDEAHKALPRGSSSVEVEEWYAEHRHEFADVLLLTQSYGKLSKPVVDLVQLVYRVRKAVALGLSKVYIRKVQDGIRGEVVNVTERVYKRKFFTLYKSHTRSQGPGVEQFAQDIKPIWKHWSVYGAVSFVLVGLIVLSQIRMPWMVDVEAAQVATAPVPSKSAQPQPVQHLTHNFGPAAAAPAAAPVSVVVQQEPQVLDPYHDLGLHLAGHLAAQDRYLYRIVASQNGQAVFALTSDELAVAGYTMDPTGPCLLRVTYQRVERVLTCDSPTVGVMARQGSGGAPAARGGPAAASASTRVYTPNPVPVDVSLPQLAAAPVGS